MTDRQRSIQQIMSLIMATTNPDIQDKLWVRADALTHKIAGQEDGLVCDACGETFELEDDVEEDVTEQAEEAGWIDDEDGTYCPEHKGYHPDHIESDYGRPVLE